MPTRDVEVRNVYEDATIATPEDICDSCGASLPEGEHVAQVGLITGDLERWCASCIDELSLVHRLNESNARYEGCKLGTASKSVWIHDSFFPLEKGDVIRYSEEKNGSVEVGRVIADPEERYLFIGKGSHTPLLD